VANAPAIQQASVFSIHQDAVTLIK